MTETYKLKIKIGPHEFEAEGDAAAVKDQFEIFKDLVKDATATTPATPQAATSGGQAPPSTPLGSTLPPPANNVDDALPRIMKADSRVVSLTVTAKSNDDAVLLLLYGQKALRSNDSVTGAEIMSGLQMSGVAVERADKLLIKLADAGDAIAVGIGRAKRYRLTNPGIAKARALSAELIANVA